jgi:hypothetical protein
MYKCYSGIKPIVSYINHKDCAGGTEYLSPQQLPWWSPPRPLGLFYVLRAGILLKITLLELLSIIYSEISS